MKKLYWKPNKVSRTVLSLIAVFSLCGLVAVDRFKITKNQPHFREKLAASKLARQALTKIREERIRRNIAIDPEVDPAQTGMIGELMSSITSNNGHLPAKQTSVNPNFAAVVVHLLKQAGVRQGDLVAVGLSGSFPAVNIAVYSAIQTLKLKPVIIASASASQWGANIPEFSWLDMENYLFQQGIFQFRAAAASLGGIEDRGLGMTKKGRKILVETINRNGLPFLEVENYQQSLNNRLAIYREQAGPVPIRAYINVGGGTSSVGKKLGKISFRSGLNRPVPFVTENIESVMSNFVEMGVPVIHLVRFNKLADRYGLPRQPGRLPAVGQGIIFVRKEYSRILATSVLIAIFLVLFAFIRSDLGFRIVQTVQPRKASKRRPEKMA